MWNAIILLIRKAFLKNQLKKEERKSATAELKKQVSKKIKKIKFKIFGINVSLTFVVISAIISFILFSMMLFALLSFMGAVSGNTILGWKEDEVQEKDPEKNWVFDNPNIYDPDTGELNISGGIYPKDPIMKNRALIMQIYQRSAEDAAQRFGISIPPEYYFGIMIRETGGYKLFEAIDANKSTDWLTKLTYDNPACNKGSNCNYMKAGVSHFVGGKVVNGKDTGDPGSQAVNNQNSVITQNGGHALGYMQWEIPHITNRTASLKAAGVLFPVSELGIDTSSLSHIDRPNYFYMPDTICLTCNFVAQGVKGLSSDNYHRVISYDGYSKLNDRNKEFILFCIQQTYYAGGGLFNNGADLCIEMIDWVNSGKIQYLDCLLDGMGASFYNTSSHKASNAMSNTWFDNYFKPTYNIKSDVSKKSNILYGIYAACAGKNAWNAMKAEVDAAEKEQIIIGGGNTAGNWIDYVGSGKFKPIGDGKYYSNKMQATIFHQPGGSYYATHKCSFCEKSWGGLRPNNTGIMADAGCGVYSTAFCITNLTGTLVTVEDIYNKGLIRSLALPNDNVCKIAQAYGLESELKLVPNSDEQFKNEVLEVLNSGGMVLSVWRSASKLGEPKSSFAWYSGDNGHFMVIRGYNKTNGKFRVFTSCGANGKTLEDTGIIELDPSVVRKYLSTSSGRYYETIKLKGGVSGGQTSSGVTGPVSGTFNWNLNNADGTINKAEVDKLQKEITASIGNPKVGWKLYAQGSFSSANANKYFKWSLNHLETLQCTWYAFGRAMEYLNEVKGYNFTWETLSPYLSGNGGHYYAQNKASGGFAYGSVPKQNSLVCYKYANSKNDSGHIAYVEVVNEVNKTYRMSECGSGKGWGGITRERKFNENYGEEILQGFIYLDEPLKAGK